MTEPEELRIILAAQPKLHGLPLFFMDADIPTEKGVLVYDIYMAIKRDFNLYQPEELEV